MGSGRNNQLIKQVGEYLVAAELCRRGYIATTFTGNVPEFDILAINGEFKTISVQVKTIQKGNWQFDASKFLTIELNGKVQKVSGKKKLNFPDLIYIFVKLKTPDHKGEDEFYILGAEDLQVVIYNHYQKYLKEKNGIKPGNTESFHTSVLLEDLRDNNYKENWELFKQC